MSAVPTLPESVLANAAGDEHNGIADSSQHAPAQVHKNAIESLRRASFTNNEAPVDHSRPMRVVVIGAGFSGIYLGIRLPERLRNVDLCIYEKNAGVGGTWWENRYPGCACDIPSHSYQYSFNPNPKWSALYAPSPEIREYLQGTYDKYSVDRFTKLRHRVEHCSYDEGAGQWRIKVENLETQETFSDTADVLVNARGALNEISWPSIEGLQSFKGEIMHSADWNQDYDFANKRTGIIGSGSSSIQIVPQLQILPGAQLSVYVRNRTWISPPFGQQLWDKMGMTELQFSDEQKDKFVERPEEYHEFRVAVEQDLNFAHAFSQYGTPLQKGARQMFEASMKQRLASKPEIFETLVPNFAPGCRRLTPGPGYLEALTQPNVEFVTDAILKVEPTGIRTRSGRLHELDALVCATGFRTFTSPPFPVIGRGGQTLEQKWKRYPQTYLSLAVDGFPNHFFMLGPNSGIGAGSLTIMLEAQGDYIVKAIRKLQKENLKCIEAKPGRVQDFVEYSDAYFQRTVYKDDCKSWYKNSIGEVTGLWPGSSLHCLETLRSPRWEDWEYESKDDPQTKNLLAWLGNGSTANQMQGRHQAWYLYPEFMDAPLAPRPEEKSRYDSRPFSY